MAEKNNTETKTPRKTRTYEERIAELEAKAAAAKEKQRVSAEKKYNELVSKFEGAAAKVEVLGNEITELAERFGFQLPARLSEVVALADEVSGDAEPIED